MRNVTDARETTPQDGELSLREKDDDESSRCDRDSALPGSSRYDALIDALAAIGARLREAAIASQKRPTMDVCVGLTE